MTNAISWQEVSVWLWGILLILVGVIWTLVIGRVSKLEGKIDMKASLDSITVLSDAQIKLMDHFVAHEKEDRERFDKIISGIGELKGNMNALLVRKREGEG